MFDWLCLTISSPVYVYIRKTAKRIAFIFLSIIMRDEKEQARESEHSPPLRSDLLLCSGEFNFLSLQDFFLEKGESKENILNSRAASEGGKYR